MTTAHPLNTQCVDSLKYGDSAPNKVSWHNVAEAVKLELYPLIATSLGQSVDRLVDEGALSEHDLSGEATDKVIEELKTRKVLFSKEIEYLRKGGVPCCVHRVERG